ncbi:MAG: exonuclease SbcCD subunit D [Rhodothermales bacterium]|nr:exonuclease SbcCD subunit D [Rhodothermales bacterium]
MRILHTADIHLGYETHGRLDPETGLNTRLLDFQRCFRFMVEHALDEDVDLFLFCGDAYRTADPTPTQQKLFAECLRPIAEAGVPIVMVIGNHDHPVSFGKASAVDIFSYLTGDVHIFRRPTFCAPHTAYGPIPTKAGPLQLIALPWPIRSVLLSKEEHRKKAPDAVRDYIEALYTDFVAQSAAELEPALPAVVAGHFSVHDAELGGSERTSLIAHEPKFTAAQLALPGVDYVALGHIHKYQDRNRAAYERGEGAPVVYPSSIDRISFKEHDAEKGFVVVDVEGRGDEKETTYAFVPTPARRFVTVETDAREADDPTARILRDVQAADVAEAVVRVRYQVSEEQVPQVDVGALRDALSGAYAVAAIERVVDPAERKRTTAVRREAGLAEAMTQYVAQHERLHKMKDRLVEAALEIERQVEGREE